MSNVFDIYNPRLGFLGRNSFSSQQDIVYFYTRKHKNVFSVRISPAFFFFFSIFFKKTFYWFKTQSKPGQPAHDVDPPLYWFSTEVMFDHTSIWGILGILLQTSVVWLCVLDESSRVYVWRIILLKKSLLQMSVLSRINKIGRVGIIIWCAAGFISVLLWPCNCAWVRVSTQLPH